MTTVIEGIDKTTGEIISDDAALEEGLRKLLDQMADWQAQRDLLDIDKRNLLGQVKVPDEVNTIIADGQRRQAEINSRYEASIARKRAEISKQLETVVIPDEIRALIEDVERQRSELRKRENDFMTQANGARAKEIERASQETQDKVKQTYIDVEARKRDIEAEFAGKFDAIEKNLKALEDGIRNLAKRAKRSIKGKFFQVVYVRGRVSWNTDALDKYANEHPEVAYFRKEGDPSVQIRTNK